MSAQAQTVSGRIQLLTVADVMAALQIGRTTVYRLFNSGQLSWVQIGAHRRVSELELARFVADNQAIAS